MYLRSDIDTLSVNFAPNFANRLANLLAKFERPLAKFAVGALCEFEKIWTENAEKYGFASACPAEGWS